mmetsp:Transcript_6725/g.11976  ORF Transcript_6725/g.11976 Transcript_6725/m.11976 type:complete len:306 (-) Transcript_6725:36-953(-)
MAQDKTLIQFNIGPEPSNPGLQFLFEIIMGGNDYENKLNTVAEEIGEFLPLVGYVVVNAASNEAAVELANYLQSLIDNMLGGSVSQSVLAALFPTVQFPNAGGEDKVFAIKTRSHNSNVVITISPNEEINEQANLVVSRSASQVEELFDNEHGFKIEIDSSANVTGVLSSDNPVLSLLDSFKIKLELLLVENSLSTLEAPLQAAGLPPQAMQAYQFAKLFHNLDFGLSVHSPSNLPNGIRNLIQSTDDTFKGVFQAVQMIPEEFRSILDKLAELATGSLEIYLHHKAFVRLVIIARGASELLKAN